MEALLSYLSNGGTIRRLYTQGNDSPRLIGAELSLAQPQTILLSLQLHTVQLRLFVLANRNRNAAIFATRNWSLQSRPRNHICPFTHVYGFRSAAEPKYPTDLKGRRLVSL